MNEMRLDLEKRHVILAAGLVFVFLVAVLAPVARHNGIVGVVLQMDRNSGDRREVIRIALFDIPYRSEPSLWIAEYATPRGRSWETVHMNTGNMGVRINWKWSNVHAGLRMFGDTLEGVDANEEVRSVAAAELFRLIRTTDNVGLISSIMYGIGVVMWERFDQGGVMDAESMRQVFAAEEAEVRELWAEAGKRANAKP